MKKVLGKGLNALLPSPPPNDDAAVVELDVGRIEPNPEQPRKNFDDEAIAQLAESIATVGVIQPIIVVDEGGYYRIIAGERRWRAARIAGLSTIPAIIRAYSGEQRVEVALIENLQRQDLNPIEEANGYERLITEYGYTQDKVAAAVGKSRSAVANSIRLLRLSENIKLMISGGSITAGHARALLAIGSDERREAVANLIINNGLNVRQAETLASRENAPGGAASPNHAGVSAGTGSPGYSGVPAGGGSPGENARSNDENARSEGDGARTGGGAVSDGARGELSGNAEREAALRHIEDELRSYFNTRVSLTDTRGKTGKIVIEYYGDEDLNRLLEQFGIKYPFN